MSYSSIAENTSRNSYMRSKSVTATLLVRFMLATSHFAPSLCLMNTRDDTLFYIITVVLSIMCLFYHALNTLKYWMDCISCHLMIGNKFRNSPKVITMENTSKRIFTCRTWGAWVIILRLFGYSMITQKHLWTYHYSQLALNQKYTLDSQVDSNQDWCLFRYVIVMKKEELAEYARREIKTARSRYQEPGDDLLFPVLKRDALVWGSNHSDSLITPKKLAFMCSSYKFPHRNSRHWDEHSMGYYLDYVDMADCYKPKDIRLEDYLPNFAPLYDFFCYERKRGDMWVFNPQVGGVFPMKYLNLRNVDYSLLTSVVVKEIIIGVTPATEILKIDDWWRSQFEFDQLTTPNKLLSLDVEEKSLPKTEFEEYLYPNTYQGTKVKIRVKFRPKERGAQLPVKIMFGNGHSWCVMVTLPFPDTPPDAEFVYVDRCQIQPELVELFRRMPCVTGVGIGSDYSEIIELFRTLSWDKAFSMNGCIELSSMAALAGANFPIYNMQALSVQLFGGILNKNCSPGDGKWGLPWIQIPDSLKIYCLGDVKFGHMVAMFLYHLLINDMFPDPDIVQSFLRIQQQEFGEWFAGWVISVLDGIEVVPELLDGASTREELINSLKERVYTGQSKCPRSEYTPTRVLDFYRIRGNWPSLTKGGPRYLHQVRDWFIEQEVLMFHLNIPGWKQVMPYPVDSEMREAATYAIAEVAARTLDYSVPTDIPRGLTVHPDIRYKTLHGTKLGDLTSKRIATHAENEKRLRREMTYETVRLDLSNVDDFFRVIRADRFYKKFMRSYYDEIRAIVLRCTGQLAPRIPWIERVLLESNKKLHRIQKDKIQLLRIELDERLDLADFLFDRMTLRDGQIMKQTWRGQVPKLSLTKPPTKKKGSRTDYLPVEYLEAVKAKQPKEKKVSEDEVDGSDVPLPLDSDEDKEMAVPEEGFDDVSEEQECSVEDLDELLSAEVETEQVPVVERGEDEVLEIPAPEPDPSRSEDEVVEIPAPEPDSSKEKPKKEYRCGPLPFFPRKFKKRGTKAVRRRPTEPDAKVPPPKRLRKLTVPPEKVCQDEVEEFERMVFRASSSPEMFQGSDSR